MSVPEIDLEALAIVNDPELRVLSLDSVYEYERATTETLAVHS